MLTAEIPNDGKWYELPDRPVASIEAPTNGFAIDIDEKGVGWVCNCSPWPTTVEYTIRENADG